MEFLPDGSQDGCGTGETISKRPRRNHTPDYKAKVVLAAANGAMAQAIFQNAGGQAKATFAVIESLKAGKPAPDESLAPFEAITKDNVQQHVKK